MLRSRQEVLLLEAVLSTELHPFFLCTHLCSNRGSVTHPPQRWVPLKHSSSSTTNQALNNYSLHTTTSFCMFCMISLAINETGDQAAKGQICKYRQVHSSQRNRSRVSLAASRTGSKGSVSRSGPKQCSGERQEAPLSGGFGGRPVYLCRSEGSVSHRPEHTAVFQC